MVMRRMLMLVGLQLGVQLLRNPSSMPAVITLVSMRHGMTASVDCSGMPT